MASVKKCSYCGSDKLIPGKVLGISTGMTMLFRPTSRKFLTLKMGIRVNARACPECGAIQLLCKTAELKKEYKA